MRGDREGILLACVAAGCLIAGACFLPSGSPGAAADIPLAERVGIAETPSPGPSGDEAAQSSKEAALQGEERFEVQTVVYAYEIQDAAGGTHQVTETATFGEDGLLSSSELALTAGSQEEADRILADLERQFGEAMKEGAASADEVVCVVEFSGRRYNEAAYAQLLGERMSGFRVLSRA